MWPKDYSWDILVMNVAAFCPGCNSLLEAKVKRFGLIPLTEEISKHSGMDPVVCLKVLNKEDLQ